ncbi:MAG: hypothetical protein G01um101466_78 [Parcubacteria group bacterium Gr01-1014_66]|nr:MAG: hypothetical protein G01um101466_78 [Parcubacteria group bacterium Gr01-1014_66]
MVKLKQLGKGCAYYVYKTSFSFAHKFLCLSLINHPAENAKKHTDFVRACIVFPAVGYLRVVVQSSVEDLWWCKNMLLYALVIPRAWRSHILSSFFPWHAYQFAIFYPFGITQSKGACSSCDGGFKESQQARARAQPSSQTGPGMDAHEPTIRHNKL